MVIRLSELCNQLLKEIAYAKSSLFPRELLYEAHGAIKMAHQLGAISTGEYLALETACVKDGINNPKDFRRRCQKVGKFKVSYKGFVYVQARDSDHAVEQFDDGEEIYDEREVALVEEVDEFLVDF